MDVKGFSTALKLLVAIAILAVIVIIAQVMGMNKTYNPVFVARVTVTPSATVVPTESPTLETIEDIDYMNTELEKAVSEIDQLQQDLDSLDESLSTNEIDTLTKELDTIN